MPIVGKYIVLPNMEHHKYPSKFTQTSYLDRNTILLIPTLGLAALFYWLGSPFWCIVMLFLSQVNEIHCWAHKKSNGFIRFWQQIGLLQSPQHHNIHHERPFDKYYCIMTNWLNPILSKIKFWQIMEYLLSLLNINIAQERAEA